MCETTESVVSGSEGAEKALVAGFWPELGNMLDGVETNLFGDDASMEAMAFQIQPVAHFLRTKFFDVSWNGDSDLAWIGDCEQVMTPPIKFFLQPPAVFERGVRGNLRF